MCCCVQLCAQFWFWVVLTPCFLPELLCLLSKQRQMERQQLARVEWTWRVWICAAQTHLQCLDQAFQVYRHGSPQTHASLRSILRCIRWKQGWKSIFAPEKTWTGKWWCGAVHMCNNVHTSVWMCWFVCICTGSFDGGWLCNQTLPSSPPN